MSGFVVDKRCILRGERNSYMLFSIKEVLFYNYITEVLKL